MYNKIIQSLQAISDSDLGFEAYSQNQKLNRKSNSFGELSDWNSKNRYKFDRSIILPPIKQEKSMQFKEMRKVESQLGHYWKNNRYEAKSMDMRKNGKIAKKNSQIIINDYFLNKEKPVERHHSVLKSDIDVAKQSIINRVMARKNKLKKKQFFQQFSASKNQFQKIQNN